MSIIENFRKQFFKKYNNCAALVLSHSNRLYLSGFSSSDGVVLITPNSSYLIVDFRYFEMAKNKSNTFVPILADRSLLAVAKELLDKEKIKSIIIEDDYVTLSLSRRIKEVFNDCEIASFEGFLNELRSVKTEDEIKRIQNAQNLTDATFSHLLEILSPSMTENEVACELDFFMRRNGAEECAFKTIAVSGKKSSLPHGEPSDILLTKNSFLTLDFGAKLDGYCSDMTRTVVIGKADEEMKRVYDIVLSAQLSAINAVHENVIGCDVDYAARKIIADNGFGNCFGHSTGHGVGIDVHEAPSFSPNYKKEIKKNSVLSVEPGIYIEGKFGVRIEDLVVVGDKGAVNLTKSTKNLIEIG
ncbi:MAG: aminopeptidase P family protein [Ruminococcaceae bacterium]|nr:aminopeptidase P family protein [Oscillospiraceae bacterium]